METTNSPCDQLAVFADKILTQKTTAAELGAFLKQTSQKTLQQDQLEALDILKRRITNETLRLMEIESSAAYAATKVNLMAGVGGLVLGSLVASITGNKNPIATGLRVSQQMLGGKTPSGNVMVSVGGEPTRVKALSISELARDSRRSEVEIITSLRRKGYLLTTIPEFNQVIDVLKSEVVDGAEELPLNIEERVMELSKNMNMTSP